MCAGVQWVMKVMVKVKVQQVAGLQMYCFLLRVESSSEGALEGESLS